MVVLLVVFAVCGQQQIATDHFMSGATDPDYFENNILDGIPDVGRGSCAPGHWMF